MPHHICVNREGLAAGEDPPGFVETEDYVELAGARPKHPALAPFSGSGGSGLLPLLPDCQAPSSVVGCAPIANAGQYGLTKPLGQGVNVNVAQATELGKSCA